MNSLKKTTICLLFLCIGVNCVFSEVPEQINFSYISINEGLSQSTVFSIDQDQRGNMWFATYDGVNKYDGYSFTVYQHNEEDPNSIANDISRIVKTDLTGKKLSVPDQSIKLSQVKFSRKNIFSVLIQMYKYFP